MNGLMAQLRATPIPSDIAPSSPHYFSFSGQQIVTLPHALNITERVVHSVTLYLATFVNDSKTVSLLQQQSAGQHTPHLVNDVLYTFVIHCMSFSLSLGFLWSWLPIQSHMQVEKTMAAAEKWRRTDMSYNGLSNYSSTLARISTWSSAVGM
jgi:hypothetical protein